MASAGKPLRRRLPGLAIPVLVVLLTFGVGSSQAVDPPIGDATSAADVSSGLQTLATSLGGLDGLGRLANNVPFTNVGPTAAGGLAYATSFANSLKAQLAAAPPFTSLTDLQSFLNDPARDVTLGSGVHVDIGSNGLSESGGIDALNVTLTLSRAPSTPLKLDTADVNVDGGSVALTFGASLDLTVKYDPAQAAGNKVYLDESVAPAIDTTFAGSANFTSSPFHVNLGFTDVTVGGTVDTGATIRAHILDPDSNGQVTQSELASSAPQDLFDLTLPSSHANASLSLSSDVQTPLAAPLPSATITESDSDLANGLDTPTVTLGPLGDFKNMQPQDFLSGIASLAVMVRSLEASGPAAFDLPFLHKDPTAPQGSPIIEHLADVVDFNKKLVKFFQDNGLSGNNDPLSLNLDASKLAQVDTVQEVMTKLEAALGISAGTLGLAYDPTSKHMSFTVGEPNTVTLGDVTAHVDFGDQLKNAGITDSTSTVSGGADATVHPSYSWALKVGVDMSPAGQTPVADRFFVVPTQTYFKADLPITATLDMAARIGFLGVSLKSAPTGGPAGNVQLLAAADGSKPMVQLKLKDPGNDQLSLQQIFDAFGSDQHPFDPFSVLDANDVGDIVNAAVPPFDLKAAATIGDAGTTVADGAVNVGWSDITDASSLSLTANADFNEKLLDFDIDPSNPAAMFTQIMNVLGPLADQLSSLVASDPKLQKKLPVINQSFSDIVKEFDKLKEQVNDFATSPSAFLQEFEQTLQDRIAEAISSTPLTQVEKDKLVDLEFIDPAGPPTLLFHLAFGVCGTPPGGTPPAGCTVTHELSAPLNFDLPSVGGLVGSSGTGNIEITANAIAKITFGIKLPEVTTMPGQLPQVSGTPELFIDTDPADTSIRLDVSAETSDDTSLTANLGPLVVHLGKAKDPETVCNDSFDNDGDGFVNDGCPADGTPEQGADCASGNAADDDGDGLVNDGCDPAGLPIQAKVGAKFHLEHDTGGDHRLIVDPTDLSNLADWLGQTIPTSLSDFRPATQFNCTGLPGGYGPGPFDACAVLPVIIGDVNNAPAGNVTFAVDDLFNGPVHADADPNIGTALLAQALDWGVWIDGLDQFTAQLQQTLDAGTFKGSDVPVVGKDLSAGAKIVKDFRDNIVTPLKNIKDDLKGASVPNVKSKIQSTLFDALSGANILVPFDATAPANTVPSASDIHVDLLCGDDEHVCADGEDPTTISDASVSFGIGGTQSTSFAFDTGLPGLQLRMDDPITASVTWRLDVMFGLSKKHGFYVRTNEPSGMNSPQELTLAATVDLPATGIEGDIAFLRFDISNNNTALNKHDLQLGLTADIKGGDLDSVDGGHKLGFADLSSSDPANAADVAVELSGDVDINLHVVTSVNIPGLDNGDAGLPKLDADFLLTWSIGAGISLNGGVDSHIGDFQISFQNVALDLGQFFSGFLGPVVREVQRFTKPLQPVIDTISAPIPGISDLSELAGGGPVTMIDFLEKASGADLTLVKRVIQLIRLINNLPTSGTSIPLGDFDVLSDVAAGPALTGDSADRLINTAPGHEDDPENVFDYAKDHNSISGNADVLDDSRNQGGLSFPAFENPKQLFQLLVGKDVKLIEFDAGELSATASFDITIGPFPVGPVPVSIIIGGSFGVEGHFAIGYGTHGIRLAVKNLTDENADHNGWNVAALLFDGVFLDDLDQSGVDVPEIRLFAEVHAGAEVDIVIASAGIEVGLKAEVDLNLHDGGRDPAHPTQPAPTGAIDGVLYIDELASMWNNPICMFDVDGKLTVFVKFFITVGISPFDASFDVTLLDVTLLDMKDITAPICSNPPPPHLAEKHGTTLVLKMGPYVTKRNVNDGHIGDLVKDEKFTVRQLDNNAGSTHKLSVNAFGITQEYDGISKVFADGGDGDDTVLMQPGAQLSNNGGNIDTTTFDVTVPVELCGGPDVDNLQGGSAGDTLVGDGGETSHASNWGDDGVAATAGSMSCSTGDTTGAGDKLSGNGGDDSLYGNGGDDSIGGGDGNDTAYGGPGIDTMQGGQGADDLHGGDDGDSIGGGPEVDPASAQNQTNCNDGKPETPCVTTAMVSDTLNGDAGNDTISAEAGDDHVFGGADDDTLNGASGNDDLHGQAGADTISAGTGDDQADGGPGTDLVFGEEGSDTIRGGPDNDRLVGGKDADNIDGQAGDDTIFGDETSADAGGNLHETGTLPANDVIQGGDDHDVVFGQFGDDTINGGNGPDELHGEDGNDTVNGDAGNDTMFGDNGIDTMNGGTEDDTMRGGNDADVMHGDAGVDTMFGDQGADQMFGDAGADVMHGNGEADAMHGGTENDTMNGDAGTDTMFGDAGDDGMHGDANDDYLEGNAGGDTMTGDAGQDDMLGGSGSAGQADAGDTMYGGDGVTPGLPADFDVLLGDNGKIERPGGTKVTGAKIRTVTLYDLDSSDTTLYGDDTMSGDQSDDELYGGGANDTVHGNAGDDYAEGNPGNDSLFGDQGQDDLIGGTSQDGGGHPDGSDCIQGDDRTNNCGGSGSGSGSAPGGTAGGTADGDVIAGDNATIARTGNLAGTDWVRDNFGFGANGIVRRTVSLYDVEFVGHTVASTLSGGDTLYGDDQRDVLWGQGGADTIHGGAGDDYAEGNQAGDQMFGEAGNDDLVGGSEPAGRLDAGDTISGGADFDVIAGDNASLVRTLVSGRWVQNTFNGGIQHQPRVLRDQNSADEALVSGGDTITGDDQDDLIYGQGGDDTISGGNGDDTIEGNSNAGGSPAGAGSALPGDAIHGDAGQDDIVGGATQPGIYDGPDTIFGDTAEDVIGGDNATIDRPTNGAGQWFRDTRRAGDTVNVVRRNVTLLDVDLATQAAQPASLSGGDSISGGDGYDQLFGQGGGDTAHGDAGDDYVEGNAGDDTLWGDLGDDDLTGGGSANDGVIDADRVGEDLRDGNDTIHGDAGDPAAGGGDVIAGDNARISRPLTAGGLWRIDADRGATLRDVLLADVEKVGGAGGFTAPAAASGTDTIYGEGGADVAFGQGNGGLGNDWGTESGAAGSANCFDGVDNSDANDPYNPLADLSDPNCRAATPNGDQLFGQGGGDYLEGNQGSDLVSGGDGEDDVIGGSSSNDGHIDAIRAPAERSGPVTAPANLLDGNDAVQGDAEDDTVLGDNGFVDRYLGTGGAWIHINSQVMLNVTTPVTTPDGGSYGPYDVVRRNVTTVTTPEFAGAFGSDLVYGGDGNDDLYGMLGHDWIEGGPGEDGVVADMGQIDDNLLGTTADGLADPATLNRLIQPQQPFLDETIDRRGVLKREVKLFAFTGAGAGVGNDTVQGNDGSDWIHTGPGDDLANGNDGEDRVFGDDNTDATPLANNQAKVDVLWGGAGHDHIWGGYGADFIDVRPRTTASAPGLAQNDPPTWFQLAGPGIPDYEGRDYIYGGWDQDAMQADFGANGPKPGDRLMDWAGSYNVYYVCPSTYGDWISTRAIAPGLIGFLQDMSQGDGAFNTATSGTSGFRETAIVFSNEVKNNTNPVHPDTPGHFTCGASP